MKGPEWGVSLSTSHPMSATRAADFTGKTEVGQAGGMGIGAAALLTLGWALHHSPHWLLQWQGSLGPLLWRSVPLPHGPRDSQDVADDSDTPHVRGIADGLIIDDFRRYELRGAKEDLQRACILCNRDGEGSITRTFGSQPAVSECHLCAGEGHRRGLALGCSPLENGIDTAGLLVNRWVNAQ